ncbi:sulfite exporter TauE/SafE family protein [Polymorphobacter sp.]|uniref:sulfite exporter TauE/SafE family protein n=1 Tax=Polymorphobacter sp. TaxID=1909290 RepID=UPI003F6FECBE
MLDFSTVEIVDLLPYMAAGFAAQIIDGALGMAFGAISSTLLVGVLGVPPAQASASVHFAEVFTTGASGLSHAFHKNIDWALFKRLALPGILGGITGAYLLTNIDADMARPLVMAYLLAIGLLLLVRTWRFPEPRFSDPRVVAPLGAAGGFLDAAGGGGWGPVVTSNLLLQGGNPRKTIGTVSATEFFLTVAISVTFIWQLGLSAFTIATLGLLLGGVIAAPFGAALARHVRPRLLLGLVGIILVITSAFSIWQALNG